MLKWEVISNIYSNRKKLHTKIHSIVKSQFLNKIHPKIHLESWGTLNNQTILRKKMKLEASHFLFSGHSKATVTKIVWYLHKNRKIDQCERIREPRNNPHIYDHISSTAVARQFSGENIVSSTNGAGKIG